MMMTMTGFRVVCCISLMLLLNLSSVSRVIGVILSASEPSQIHEDENVDKLVKTVPDLIQSYGYPVEEYFLTTSDGYILGIHRIPHGRDGVEEELDGKKEARIPVFLGHCLVGSSAIWSFGPPDFSLAYLLADAGYDVWMPNMRGNSYSRNHTHLNPDTDTSFWKFSFEESGRIDYPETIDFILEKTGHEDLFFIGYSMGTTQYLVLLSELPEYNSKIRGGFLLGPTAFGGNASNPMVVLSEQAENIQSIFEWIGMHEFMPNYLEFKSWLAHSACTLSSSHMEVCRSFYAFFVGMHSHTVNITMVPTYMSHTPAGSSLTQFTHFAQQFRNGGKFAKFDYGHVQNLLTYGTLDPPEYSLEKVSVPTALFVGDVDGFADPKDADLLASRIQNVIINEVVAYENWSHLGFIWSLEAKTLIYDKIVDIMKKMS